MNFLFSTASFRLFAFTALHLLVAIPHIQNDKAIAQFEKEKSKLPQLIKDYKFVSSITKISSDAGVPVAKSGEQLVTYRLSGDTIQYYQSGDNKFLLYCRFNNPATYSKRIHFLALDKKALFPVKYQKNDKVVLESINAFEEMGLTFYQNKISRFSYLAHPD